MVKFQVFFLSVIIANVSINAADNKILYLTTHGKSETVEKVYEQCRNEVGHVLYEYVTVVVESSLEAPVTMSIESANFCEIDPATTHTSPLALKFKKLTEKVTVKPGKEHKFKYLYNVQEGAKEKEFLLFYPRLYATDGTHSGYISLHLDGYRENKIKFSVNINSNTQKMRRWDSSVTLQKKLKPCEEAVRLIHFLWLRQKNYEQYGAQFLQKCSAHIEEKEDFQHPQEVVETGLLKF